MHTPHMVCIFIYVWSRKDIHVHDMYSGGTRRGCLNWAPQPRPGGAVRQIIGRTWRVGERVLPQSETTKENPTANHKAKEPTKNQHPLQ